MKTLLDNAAAISAGGAAAGRCGALAARRRAVDLRAVRLRQHRLDRDPDRRHGGIAPNRQADLARLGVRALAAERSPTWSTPASPAS